MSRFSFLRFKSPQPEFLSRVLRDKIRRYEKKYNALTLAKNQLPPANSEDIWEDQIRPHIRRRDSDKASYKDPVNQWKDDSSSYLGEIARKSSQMNAKFLAVLGKETALIKIERKARRRKRIQERDVRNGIMTAPFGPVNKISIKPSKKKSKKSSKKSDSTKLKG